MNIFTTGSLKKIVLFLFYQHKYPGTFTLQLIIYLRIQCDGSIKFFAEWNRRMLDFFVWNPMQSRTTSRTVRAAFLWNERRGRIPMTDADAFWWRQQIRVSRCLVCNKKWAHSARSNFLELILITIILCHIVRNTVLRGIESIIAK